MPTIPQLEKALKQSWSKETAWFGSFNSKNSAAGHCRVTALVVQKLLGGKILFAEISKKPLYTHYWNKLPNGKEIDLTIEQFEVGTVISRGKIVSISDTMNATNIKKTFPILLEKVKNNLK